MSVRTMVYNVKRRKWHPPFVNFSRSLAAVLTLAKYCSDILCKIYKVALKSVCTSYPAYLKKVFLYIFVGTSLTTFTVNAQVNLASQVKIADNGLYFDGVDLDYGNVDEADTGEKYDYFFGRSISAHGDAVKTYKHFVFMTWYRGGKDDRHVMLTRLNTQTGNTVDIEFPHQHTGFRGNPLIGESHNTIGLAVSPINGTIHMVYDMHAYDDTNHDGKFKDDFFRYSFSIPGTADLPDEQFTLDKFVKDTSTISQGDDDYKHVTMTGDIADKSNFARLTYPKFFKTSDGTLLLYMRLGGNNNGAYLFNRYNAETQTWSTFTKFNENNQQSKGNEYNWGLYGNMKYLNGKLRVGFQQRSSDNNDKYKYQNGVYYAYSDHPQGFGDWFDHSDEKVTWPLINSDEIKVFEPGDYITHEQPNSVYIVQDFDWTVTARGDIHIISLVQTNSSASDAQEFGFSDVPREKVYIHSYKPAGADEFIIDSDFIGATSIYTSGNNVYVIGLNNGRPYVEVAQGGTNSFTRVYEQVNGPQFSHGTIYIDEGKVYYYLMERGTGSALPLYLQIIDLDIPKVEVAFEQTNVTLLEGYSSVSISAVTSIQDEKRNIENVALYIEDELVSTLDTAPFIWTQSESKLQALALGTYTVKAVVTDDFGETSQTSTTLSVIDPMPHVSFSQDNYQVIAGYDTLSLNVEASTPVAERVVANVGLYIDDNLIRTESTAPYQWGRIDEFSNELLNFPVGNYTIRAVVTDSEGLSAQALADLIVLEAIVAPVVNFSLGPLTIEEDYSQLTITVDASSSMDSRSIKHVTLFVNDSEVAQLSSGPYQWTSAMAGLASLPVGTHEVKAIATDSQNLQSEAKTQIVITAKVITSPPSQPTAQSPSSSSGGSLPLFLLLLMTLIATARQYHCKVPQLK